MSTDRSLALHPYAGHMGLCRSHGLEDLCRFESRPHESDNSMITSDSNLSVCADERHPRVAGVGTSELQVYFCTFVCELIDICIHWNVYERAFLCDSFNNHVCSCTSNVETSSQKRPTCCQAPDTQRATTVPASRGTERNHRSTQLTLVPPPQSTTE
jgi:hypothetical protein